MKRRNALLTVALQECWSAAGADGATFADSAGPLFHGAAAGHGPFSLLAR